MYHPHAPTRRSLIKSALCAVAAVVLLGLLPSGADAAVPPIERFPTYHPQSRCNPTPKPGTLMLANYLMRHYKGSGSLGISRGCGAGGVSEHKEGRAFDWALNVNSRRDRHYAANFLHRLRKRDRHGRRDALARRMGIMYVIWNDHIYSATYHYTKHRYLNAGCRNIRHCSKTLRHRDHMHISLTRAAAMKHTSWYQHRGAGHKKHKVRHHKVRHHKVRHHVRAKVRHHKVRHHARAKARHHKVRHHAPHRARHHATRHLRAKARHHKARHRHHRARHHVRHRRHHARHRRHRLAHRSQVTVHRGLSAAGMPYDAAGWRTAPAASNTDDWWNMTDSSEDEVDLPEAR